MRCWLSLVILLGWVTAGVAQQTPGPVGMPEGVWREQIHWLPLDIAGTRYLLNARVCRPLGEEPARVVLIAHGSPSIDGTPREQMKPTRCEGEAARWFLQNGFVVIAAMRRGHGQTGGFFAEGSQNCAAADYFRAGLESARDLAATVDYAATLPFARPTGMIVVGQSTGGWATLAYDAMPHPRVTAFVNMAGGRGGHWQGRAHNNCRPEMLSEAAGRFARTATTPMLWVYTENDSFFDPAIATAMYGAFLQAGGRAEFQRLAAFGEDGHRLFFARGGSQIWGPLVERYLASRPAQ